MSRVVVPNFSISLDGYGTGEGQTYDAPFGHAGERLHHWYVRTRTFRTMRGEPGGTDGVDEAFASGWGRDVGVEIMGRGKYAPESPWPDDWHGWWGDEPPFHTPVIVLTHHPRDPLTMAGGTTFHFVDASPAEALALARDLAPGKDVRIGGGPTTVRSFLAAGLVDHLHLAVVPIVLGRGESVWHGLEGLEERYDVEQVASPSGVVHVTMTRKA